jgi:hypothetical protein
MNKKIVTGAVVFGIAMMLGTSAFADSKPKGYGGHGNDDNKPKKKIVVPSPKLPTIISNFISSLLGLI